MNENNFPTEEEFRNAIATIGNAMYNKYEEPSEITGAISYKDKVYGKGFLWAGQGYTKQLVLVSDPDRIFSSEDIDLAKGKKLSINNVGVLSAEELGPTVTKSNLRQVGRLKGLLVDGSINIDDYIVYDANSNRLGIGTEEPNGALSINEDGVEVVIGSKDFTKGSIGTYTSHNLEITTDNVARITVTATGNIKFGNENQPPAQVTVHGKISVGVNTPDPNVDLHVRGAARINNTLHTSGSEPPKAGSFSIGDIVWNSNPRQRSYIGWVCTKAGSPGIWSPFGEIR